MLALVLLRYMRKIVLTHPDHVYQFFWGLIPNIAIVGVLLALGYPVCALMAFVYFAMTHLCHVDDSPVPPSDFTVSVIGAGFSGIAMAIRLHKMGVKYTIYEMAPSVGGVWFHNRYPGCACDIPSHLYSLSGELKSDWTRQYAPQDEILEYLRKLAADHKLNVKLNTRFVSAKWHADRHKYLVTFSSPDGELTIWSNALAFGIGGLREVVTPEFSGSTIFQGKSFHSSAWDPQFEYSGKNIAIIGTGASAIQIIPKISGDVGQLYVFQRTPTWSLKKNDFSMPKNAIKIFELIPFTMKIYRLLLYLFFEMRYFLAFSTKFAYFNNMLRYLLQLRTQYIVKNSKLARSLTPEYPPGCKQIAPSDDYFYSFKRKNVHLVVSPIRNIINNGIMTENGSFYEVDAIVYATGFSPLETGRRVGTLYNGPGKSLVDHVGEEPVAYLGINFEGFPNLFSLLGPNTGLGHNSVLFMIECQANYISQCIRYMIETDRKSITVKRWAMAWFERFLAVQMPKNVYFEGCTSWYRNKNGTGTNYTMWPGSSLTYWWYTRVFDPDKYDFE